MAATISKMGVFSAPSVASRMAPQRKAFTAFAPRQNGACTPSISRGALVVVAAEEAKKRTDSAVKRAHLSEDRRVYNRAHKSAVATRMKKVFKMAEAMNKAMPASEEDVKPLESLIAAASSEIDAAVSKGIMHKNTANRRKARLSKTKRRLLISAGLYAPAQGHPDYDFYMQQKQKASA